MGISAPSINTAIAQTWSAAQTISSSAGLILSGAMANGVSTLRIGTDVGVTARQSMFTAVNSDLSAVAGDIFGVYNNFGANVAQTGGGQLFGISDRISAGYATAGNDLIAHEIRSSKSGAGTIGNLMSISAVNINTGTGTIDQAIAFYVDHSYTGNATINNAYGFYDVLGFGGSASGTVTNYKAFYFNSPQNMVNGTIVNMYAFYAEDVSGATTNNYAIYTNLGKVRFGDQVTAVKGVIFPAADPHVVDAWWNNAGTLTKSAG